MTIALGIVIFIGGFVLGLAAVAISIPNFGTLKIRKEDSRDTYLIEVSKGLDKIEKQKLVFLNVDFKDISSGKALEIDLTES